MIYLFYNNKHIMSCKSKTGFTTFFQAPPSFTTLPLFSRFILHCSLLTILCLLFSCFQHLSNSVVISPLYNSKQIKSCKFKSGFTTFFQAPSSFTTLSRLSRFSLVRSFSPLLIMLCLLFSCLQHVSNSVITSPIYNSKHIISCTASSYLFLHPLQLFFSS